MKRIIIELPDNHCDTPEKERAWLGLLKDAGRQYGHLRRLVNEHSTGDDVRIKAEEK